MKATDRIFASLMFFTRLPWWRLREVPSEAFKHTVDFWPLVGWITGGGLALSFVLYAQILPINVAIILAIATRLLLTGALHEDGLADFCDGMGGGTTRERVLTIMKDSHIGTYGVLGLIVYFALFYNTLSSFVSPDLGEMMANTLSQTFNFSFNFDHSAEQPLEISTAPSSTLNPLWAFAATLLFADVYAKSIASFIIILPYARNEESAKAKVVYHQRSMSETLCHLLRIVIALSFPSSLLYFTQAPLNPLSLIAPVLLFLMLIYMMKKKLGGYTGDCCGATFLLCEIMFLVFQAMQQ